jgi:hypothetical protein
MDHPNLAPTRGALAVLREAKNAPPRLYRKGVEWEVFAPWQAHGLNGHRRRKAHPFNVTFGGGTMRFYLTSGGILMQETSDGLIPVWLNTYDHSQQMAIVNAIARL